MSTALSRPVYLCLLALLVALGAFLRFYPSAGFHGRGFDEQVYENYARWIDDHSLWNYPRFCEEFLSYQKNHPLAFPPPTRITYVWSGCLWHTITGASLRQSLVQVSALFNTLSILLAALFALRLGGRAMSLGVAALMSTAIGLIHQSQHALIDGYFAFWALAALWAFWEVLRHPERKGLLWVYAAMIVAMMLTKENAFFVCMAFCGIILLNAWLRFGTVTRPLLLTTVAAGLAGFAALALLTGGPSMLVDIYQTQVAKSVVLPFAIKHNDGPWYRYFVEMMLVTPVLFLLALGAAFQVRKEDKAELFLLCFFGITWAIMSSIEYGFSYRYTTIWEMPLRYLAMVQVVRCTRPFGLRQPLFCTIAVGLLCVFGIQQYIRFSVQDPSYGLLPGELLRATKILKEP